MKRLVSTLALCTLIGSTAFAAIPTKVWQEQLTGSLASSVYYGQVINNEYYAGINPMGPLKFGTELIDGTSVLKFFNKSGETCKSSILLGDYLFFTHYNGGVYRMDADWLSNVTPLVSGIEESLTTDGTYIYANDDTTRGRIHKYSVTNSASSFTLTEESGWPVTTAATRIRAVTYYNGKIYASDFSGNGIYEVDTATGASTKIVNDLPTGQSYQAARYGNQLFAVGLDDYLHLYDFDGSTWTKSGDYNMEIGDLYGVGVIGNGSIATSFWASGSGKINFWNTNNPVSTAVTGKIDLADYVGDYTIVPVTVEVDGNPFSVTLAADGAFSISGVPDGTYDARVKASHWLAKAENGVVVSGNTDVGTITLINGDVDGDNEITSTDLSILALALGSTPGDGNWDATADLDGDGEVTSTDLSVLGLGLGLMGD